VLRERAGALRAHGGTAAGGLPRGSQPPAHSSGLGGVGVRRAQHAGGALAPARRVPQQAARARPGKAHAARRRGVRQEFVLEGDEVYTSFSRSRETAGRWRSASRPPRSKPARTRSLLVYGGASHSRSRSG
jgi:hypothetical protein